MQKNEFLVSAPKNFVIAMRPIELVLNETVGLGKLYTGSKSAQGKIPLIPTFNVNNRVKRKRKNGSLKLRIQLPKRSKKLKYLLNSNFIFCMLNNIATEF